jgi:hypothetical protein
MSRTDKFALFFVLLAIALSAWVALGFYDDLPQIEDEFAYLWQARVIANGDITIPSPPAAEDFLVPFVVDHQGLRFGKYPLGWPVVLSFGERIGLGWLVNPLLAGLAVWLVYRLGRKLLGDKVGLLAAGLTTISPLFLTYAGSILSHTWGLVLSLGFAMSWLDLTEERDSVPGWLPTLVAGFSLGVLALSRPWTALGVAIPFGFHGLLKMWGGSPVIRKRIMTMGLIALLLGSIHFLWQFALTGDPLLNPYTLWWPYDVVGFGEGIGVIEGGHTLLQAWDNTLYSLYLTGFDLFGWRSVTWLLVFGGLWAVRRQRKAWLIGSVFFSLVVVYLAYWVSGPRYFYEGLYSLTILSAAGIAGLAGWLNEWGVSRDLISIPLRLCSGNSIGGLDRVRRIAVPVVLAVVVGLTTIFFTPARLKSIQARYGFDRAVLEPFDTPEVQALTPALVIVHTDNWKDYGAFLHLEDPYLTSPFIFAYSLLTEDISGELAASYPDRTIIHYYPDEPGLFYAAPRP